MAQGIECDMMHFLTMSENGESSNTLFCKLILMTLDTHICYSALKTRDARFDGRFFTGVTSTGIFCRPICPARTPKIENCTFYESANAALQAGFRPCLRCRPESAPMSAAWIGTQAVVRRALTLIDEGALDDAHSMSDFAARLGLGDRHLRRLFQTQLGAAPKQIALNRRLMFAKRLLKQTQAPITDIAFASGFNSLRRFNDAYKKTFSVAPSHERGEQSSQTQTQDITLHFSYRPPYDWNGLLQFFDQRGLSGVEEVTGVSYHRTISMDGHNGFIKISNDSVNNRIIARISNMPIIYLRAISQRIKRMFDVDADPDAIAHDLSHDPALAPLIKANPGLRLPGAWDGFEIGVRAIIGQQISVKGARTIATRLVQRLGEKLADDRFLFPTPGVIANGDLSHLGLTQKRCASLQNFALNWIELDPAQPLDETLSRLCGLAGIGPWTAHYIVMRALGEPDIYPIADLALLRALEKMGLPSTKKDLEQRAENWKPWRAYGALYLWSFDHD
jgi:AraC family transcriptional regulator, regulatory protein of adaptative response / DNA-3-methyladenine glycosylase II